MDDFTSMKRCSKCGVEYPATTEYFNRCRNSLTSNCKKCRCQHRAAYNQRPDVKARKSNYAREYNHRPGVEERIKEQRREYRQLPKVKEQNRIRLREWRAQPDSKIKNKEYNQRPEVKARRRDRDRERYKRPDVKSHRREYLDRSEVKQQYRVRAHTRRAQMQGGIVTAADVDLQLKSQKGKCWHCGKKINGDDYHIDHLIPLSRGGKHDARNIVISCPFCNESKGAKLSQEWNGKLF